MKKRIQKYLAGEREGFSLVELIIVIAIMAILIGVIALAVIPNIQRSRESKDISFLDSVASATNAAIANNHITADGNATIYTFGADGKCNNGSDTSAIADAVRKTLASNPTLGSSAATTGGGKVYASWTIPADGAPSITVAICGSSDTTAKVTKYLSDPSKFEVKN